MASTSILQHMHMRIKEGVKNGVHQPNATGPYYCMRGVYEKCWGLLSDAKRMNVTWPRFRTMHICVGRELIIRFYFKLLRSHPHCNYTPQIFINISFWRCTTDPPSVLCGFREAQSFWRMDSQSFLQNHANRSPETTESIRLACSWLSFPANCGQT